MSGGDISKINEMGVTTTRFVDFGVERCNLLSQQHLAPTTWTKAETIQNITRTITASMG